MGMLMNCISTDKPSKPHVEKERNESPPFRVAFFTYISFLVLTVFGHLRDFLTSLGLSKVRQIKEPERTNGFVPLYQNFEAFFTRNFYRLVRDCWNRPIKGSPGPEFEILDRTTPDHGWTFSYSGKTTKALNLGSYNYLGFSETTGCCVEEALKASSLYGCGVGSSRCEVGTLAIHRELEAQLSEFLNTEDSLVFPMGFATNALNIPTLFDKNSCIISDQLNHSSLILGSRLAGSTIKVFKHNSPKDLENKIRQAIIYGQPRTHKPFTRIVIVVEGIYSMEGTIVNLPDIIRLKKKYGALLYLDEAHSIGALGNSGRGVIEYHNCSASDVDILMGTFTKSFAAAGGYIAGSKRLIEYLRSESYSTVYGASMPAAVAAQIISSMQVIMHRLPGLDGHSRIRQLSLNTRYVRARLLHMNLIVYGSRDSPVVPILMYIPSKTCAFSREALLMGLGLVIVGYPATSLLESRARLCLSAAHSPEMIEKTLAGIDKLADLFRIRYSKQKPPAWTYQAIAEWNRITGKTSSNGALSAMNGHRQ